MIENEAMAKRIQLYSIVMDRVGGLQIRRGQFDHHMAEFCKQLFLTVEGGEDWEQAYQYFTGQFLPNHEVEIANQSDSLAMN